MADRRDEMAMGFALEALRYVRTSFPGATDVARFAYDLADEMLRQGAAVPEDVKEALEPVHCDMRNLKWKADTDGSFELRSGDPAITAVVSRRVEGWAWHLRVNAVMSSDGLSGFHEPRHAMRVVEAILAATDLEVSHG